MEPEKIHVPVPVFHSLEVALGSPAANDPTPLPVNTAVLKPLGVAAEDHVVVFVRVNRPEPVFRVATPPVKFRLKVLSEVSDSPMNRNVTPLPAVSPVAVLMTIVPDLPIADACPAFPSDATFTTPLRATKNGPVKSLFALDRVKPTPPPAETLMNPVPEVWVIKPDIVPDARISNLLDDPDTLIAVPVRVRFSTLAEST